MDPEFVEKRREQLDGYLKSLILLLGKNPPQELAVFLDLSDYEILFMLRKLAMDIFEKGDRYMEAGESYSISPYQVSEKWITTIQWQFGWFYVIFTQSLVF